MIALPPDRMVHDDYQQIMHDLGQALAAYLAFHVTAALRHLPPTPSPAEVAIHNVHAQPLPLEARPIVQTILEAAPGASEPAVSIRKIARLAGYADSGHLREVIRCMVDEALLVRQRGGVRLTLTGEMMRERVRMREVMSA